MVQKIFVALIVVIAVVAGLLNIIPFHTDVVRLAMFGEFFMATIPILGFGALIKYLCHCPCDSCNMSCGGSCGCCKDAGCRCCGKDKMCPTTTTTVVR
jgi:hypothetical protein